MLSPAAPPLAAPAQGAAPSLAEQARALAERLYQRQQAQAQAAPCCPAHVAPPLSREETQFEPGRDPMRWHGFL